MIMPNCNGAKMDEADKQRLIGKQLLLVDIIHGENDEALRGRFFYISLEDLAQWVSVDKEEMESFIDVCASLDIFKMCECAARKYSYDYRLIDGDNAYLFLLYTFRKNSTVFVNNLDSNNISSICEELAEKNYNSYCEKVKSHSVSEDCSKGELFETIALGFLDYYVNSVKEALDLGFDWDVINRMCRLNISRARFEELVSICDSRIHREMSPTEYLYPT